jgi:hypothetical protein
MSTEDTAVLFALAAAVWLETVYPAGLRIGITHFAPYNLVVLHRLTLPAISESLDPVICVFACLSQTYESSRSMGLTARI